MTSQEDQGSPILLFSGVTRTFGPIHAIHDVSFEVLPGETVALLGPNGAGKTTVISLIAGLRRPTAGAVRAFGREPTIRSVKRALGVARQDLSFPERLRVREVVRLVSAHYPGSPPLSAVADQSGLSDIWDRYCGGLSGGEARRLALALAFLPRPRLLLLDEPTTALDFEGRAWLFETLRKLEDSGVTSLITTHDWGVAEAVATRVLVLNAGRLIADDSVNGIKSRLAVKRVTVPRHLLPPSFVTRYKGVLDRDTCVLVTNQVGDLMNELAELGIGLQDIEVRGASLEEATWSLVEEARRTDGSGNSARESQSPRTD